MRLFGGRLVFLLVIVYHGQCENILKNLLQSSASKRYQQHRIVNGGSNPQSSWQEIGKRGRNPKAALSRSLFAITPAVRHPSFQKIRPRVENAILARSAPLITDSHDSNELRPLQRGVARSRMPRMILTQPARIRLVLSVLAFLAGKYSIKVIGTANTMLIERFGVYNRQLDAGLHFTIPLVERTSFVSTSREQVLDIPPQQCITKDNAPLSADAVVYYKIVDPELARYAVTDLVLALQNLVLTQLRSEIGKLTLDDTFSARQKMNTILLDDLDRSTGGWGVKVTRVEVRDIIPSRDIMTAMELQMSAERRKRAAILDSEGRRESQVNDARGEAEAVKLQAEAEASRLEAVAQGEGRSLKILTEATGGDLDKAMQIALLSKYWTTQAELATSNNTKVLFYPSKATVPVSVDGLREMLSAD